MKDRENNTFSGNATGTANETYPSILDELLPVQTLEHPVVHRNVDDGAIRYADIKRVRVAGKRAVLLPSGQMLAKVLNRKVGQVVWVPVGRKEVA